MPEDRPGRFVATGPWEGWTEVEIRRELYGEPPQVVPPPDEDDEN